MGKIRVLGSVCPTRTCHHLGLGPIERRTQVGEFLDRADDVTFQTYGEQVSVPALRPGDVVISDDLAAHLRPEVAEAVE